MEQDTDAPAESMLLCPLCHSELQFDYDVDYILLKIEERCQCTTCGFRRKPIEATIQ